jgi:hypothetical protein
MKARFFAVAASALLVAACGGNAENTEAAADSAMAPAPMETPAPAMDSAAMAAPVDSAAMAAPVDSAAMAAPADSAAH